MFDPIQTAKVAADQYTATHGYAAYMQKCVEAGFNGWKNASKDDALRLCKALGFGQMFASARRSGTTPTPTAKKSTAEAMNDIAGQIYDGDSKSGEGDKAADDPGDVELNPHHQVLTGLFEGANAVIDPKEIYARYNAPKQRRNGDPGNGGARR